MSRHLVAPALIALASCAAFAADTAEVVTPTEPIRLLGQLSEAFRFQVPEIPTTKAPAVLRSVRKLAGDFRFTEGPAWNAKEGALYFSDIPNKTIHHWTEADDVKLIRTGVQASNGIVVDQGNLYTTSKEGVLVWSPEARQIAVIPVPEEPANMTFGGKDGRTLFITARTGLYVLEMSVRGDGFQKAGND